MHGRTLTLRQPQQAPAKNQNDKQRKSVSSHKGCPMGRHKTAPSWRNQIGQALKNDNPTDRLLQQDEERVNFQ
jgi:hypothetical protein